MKIVRLVCACAVSMFAALVIVMLVAAQSNPVARADPQLDASPRDRGLRAAVGGRLGAAGQKPPVSFAKPVIYSAGLDPGQVAVGDLNGDGKPDLAVANACQSADNCNGGVSVFFGNGDGTFQAPTSYSSGGAFAGLVAIEDVNGDGIPDLVVGNSCESTDPEFECIGTSVVGVLLGNGDGTFQSPVGYSVGAYLFSSIVVGDFDGDGKPDMAAVVCPADQSCGGFEPNEVGVLLNNGNGTFQAPVFYNSGGYQGLSLPAIAIGDLNGDGNLDIVVANSCLQTGQDCVNGGAVDILLGNGDGTFQTAVSFNSGGFDALSVAIADMNGDGKLDLVVGNEYEDGFDTSGVSVFLGNGDGTFQAPIASPGDGVSVAISDVNGDGRPDVVMAYPCGSYGCEKGIVVVLLGNGDGTFQAAVSYPSGGYRDNTLAIGDVNGDGREDLIVVNDLQCKKRCTVGVLGVLLNNLMAKTNTALTSSPNPSHVNQSVTFTATVTSNPFIPDGEVVTFYNGQTSLGTSATANSVATLNSTFPKAKIYAVKATYSGDAFHKASSGSVKQVVNP